MSKYQALIDALGAGPTEGVWNWDCDPVKNDPIGRTRYRVTTIGKTITHVYYSSYEGGPTNAAQDAAYIAEANPATIRALLADRNLGMEIIEGVLKADRDADGRIVLHGWQVAAIDAALAQMAGG